MSEEEVKEELKEEVKVEAPKEEKKVSSVDEANKILEGMEAANLKAEELVERQEALRAEQILGGKADAGAEQPVIDKEQVIKDRTNLKLKDTGYQI